MLGASWRTSLGGLIALCAAVGAFGVALSAQFDGNPETVANWERVIEAFGLAGAALGLLNARDDKVSTTEARKNP